MVVMLDALKKWLADYIERMHSVVVRATLHDLVLGKTTVTIGVHDITTAATTTGSKVLDVAEAERTSTVLVTLKFCNGSLGSISVIKPDNTAAARPTAWLILDLSLFNLANGGEQLNQVVVARRPGKL